MGSTNWHKEQGSGVFSFLWEAFMLWCHKHTGMHALYQNKVKKVILDCQGEGETIEWEVDNFALCKCKGLRAGSNKGNKETVRYTQFF